MNSDDLYEMFRTEMNDTVEPYLWSDEEVYGFVDSAQNKFVKLIGGLADTTSPFTMLPMTLTTDRVKIDKRILKIRDAYRVSDGRLIEVINFEDMRTRRIRFDGRTGMPEYLIIGMEPEYARFYPAPATVDTVQLLVDRLALHRITDEGDQELEVDEQHKDGLMYWMKYRGYSKQDAETFDKGRAADFEMKFKEYCGEALKEKARAMHKTRITAYGGIPMHGGGSHYRPRVY